MWGFALITSHLAAVVVVGWLATRHHESAVVSVKLRSTANLAEQFAGRLAGVLDDASKTGRVRMLTRKLARDAQLAYAVVTDERGAVIAHSDPGWIGRPWVRLNVGVGVTLPTAGAAEREISAEQEGQRVEFSSPVMTADGRVIGHVHLGELAVLPIEAKRVLWTLVAVSAAIVMAFVLLMYRTGRRSLVPLTGVRDNLLAFSSGLEKDLKHLRLSSSLGQVATAWNHLIDFTDELEKTISDLKTNTSLSPLFERYRQQRYRQLLDTVPVGVLWVSPDDCATYVNPRARQLLGLNDELGENPKISELPIASGPRDVISSLARAGSNASEVDLTLGQGAQRTVVRISATPQTTDGTRDGVVMVLTDVSQQKEADRARDDFLQHIAHELRTPLTNIRAYSETLADDLVDDVELQKECFNVINSETQRLSRLIEQILSVSQLEVGSALIHMDEFRLDKLLRDATQEVQAEADRKNIDLLLKLPTKVPRVRADHDQIASVLNNLLGNAIKYTPPGGQVELTCEAKGDQVELTVSDTGIGIEPAEQDRIFEKFYRVENEYVAGQCGTGLGLGIAREIVRLHGSDIAVQSVPGQGSQFRLTLAAVDEA